MNADDSDGAAPRVGVVGGGISGLALTHYLAERGAEPVTFEASDQPGGVVRSREVEGRVLDLGPQRVRETPTVAALVETLGLKDQRRYGHDDQPTYIYRDGGFRVAPLSVREAFTTDLLSWRGKARVLLEPLTDAGWEGETVEEYLTRKFGREAAHRFMAPLYTGLYGSEPDEMPMEYSLGKAIEGAGLDGGSLLLAILRRLRGGRDTPPVLTFNRGLQALPRALAERYADSVHLGTPVEAIRPAGEGGGEGAGYALHTAGGVERVDAVAITTPAGVAADLLGDLDRSSAAALDRLHYNPLAVVHLHSAFDRAGHGCQILPETGHRTLGMTWNASMLDRDGVFTSYLGGGRDPALLESDDDRIGEVAAEEFAAITDADARVLSVHRLRPGMPAYDRSWAATEDVDLPDGIALCTNYTARAGIVGRLRDAKATAGALAGER